MANYSYQSSAYSSGGGGSDAAFQQADSNRDGRIDLNEFRNFLGQNIGGGGAGGASASSYESAAFGAGGAGGAGFGGANFESSSYESSASSSGLAGGAELAFAGGAGGAGASNYESASFSSSGNFGGEAAAANLVAGGGSTFESSSSTTQVQQYATDAQGLFQDPNPQIIRRAATGAVQTYTQNIKVRFLQPPPVPPPGPLIIKEVRPPQPPPPPPLRIRQQAPPLPQPPPLVLRERPPQPPAAVASQTVIRRLAAIAVPPRSVIIERLPPLPPKPRDIIIERWVPYGAQAKRRTIVQRAAAAVQYARPRNVIIQYEPVQVRIIRQFQRLGVVQANPQAYVQQYGAQLLESSTLVQQARSAGVVEDISPPAVAVNASFSSSSFGQSGGSSSSGFEAESGLVAGGAIGLDAGAAGGFGSSSYESSSYSSGGAAGLEGGFAASGLGGGFGASSSSFESSGYSAGGAAGGADSAFATADTNRDGVLDQGEFNNFLGQNAGGASFQSSSYSSQSGY